MPSPKLCVSQPKKYTSVVTQNCKRSLLHWHTIVVSWVSKTWKCNVIYVFINGMASWWYTFTSCSRYPAENCLQFIGQKKQVLMNVINILVHVFVKTKIMNLLALMRKNLGIKNSKLLHLLFVSYACVFRWVYVSVCACVLWLKLELFLFQARY